MDEERRMDVDGKRYTKAEFKLRYREETEWNSSTFGLPRSENLQAEIKKKVTARPSSKTERERRFDQDGNPYTKEEFLEFYGGLNEWAIAPTTRAASRYQRKQGASSTLVSTPSVSSGAAADSASECIQIGFDDAEYQLMKEFSRSMLGGGGRNKKNDVDVYSQMRPTSLLTPLLVVQSSTQVSDDDEVCNLAPGVRQDDESNRSEGEEPILVEAVAGLQSLQPLSSPLKEPEGGAATSEEIERGSRGREGGAIYVQQQQQQQQPASPRSDAEDSATEGNDRNPHLREQRSVGETAGVAARVPDDLLENMSSSNPSVDTSSQKNTPTIAQQPPSPRIQPTSPPRQVQQQRPPSPRLDAEDGSEGSRHVDQCQDVSSVVVDVCPIEGTGVASDGVGTSSLARKRLLPPSPKDFPPPSLREEEEKEEGAVSTVDKHLGGLNAPGGGSIIEPLTVASVQEDPIGCTFIGEDAAIKNCNGSSLSPQKYSAPPGNSRGNNRGHGRPWGGGRSGGL